MGSRYFEREFFDRPLGVGMEEDAILAASGEEERQKRRTERSEDCHFKHYVNNLTPKAKSRRRVGKCFLEKIVRTATDPRV